MLSNRKDNKTVAKRLIAHGIIISVPVNDKYKLTQKGTELMAAYFGKPQNEDYDNDAILRFELFLDEYENQGHGADD